MQAPLFGGAEPSLDIDSAALQIQKHDAKERKPQFYQNYQKLSGSMPQLLKRDFRFQSADDLSSHGDRNSATGSKVWGNSVLSANFEAPIDIEDEDDEDDIRQFAAFNSLRHFLQQNDLHVFLHAVDSLHQVSLDDLKRYDESQIRQFFAAHAGEDGEDNLSRLVEALHKRSPAISP